MKYGLIVRLAAMSGAAGIAAGAFGAHAAHGAAIEWLRTGAQYQMIHAVAALVALRLLRAPVAAMLMLGGSILFAATLYALALGAPRWFGAITPLGGVAMIVGWLLLAVRRA